MNRYEYAVSQAAYELGLPIDSPPDLVMATGLKHLQWRYGKLELCYCPKDKCWFMANSKYRFYSASIPLGDEKYAGLLATCNAVITSQPVATRPETIT